MNQRHCAIAAHLSASLYGAPPSERLGVMKRILDCATEQEVGFRGAYLDDRCDEGRPTAPRIWKTSPADLRRVLTDPKLLAASPTEANLFHRNAPGSYMTISQAANAYTQKFFGVSLRTYLQQTRIGTLREEHPVSHSTALGAVPRLSNFRKVKCWHRPLCNKRAVVSASQFKADADYVDTIVEAVRAKVEPLATAA
ncbi:hypothetical protein [Poseidonocella pacifica]|nr:hypothetical protein [Poseidonocella pacifica]